MTVVDEGGGPAPPDAAPVSHDELALLDEVGLRARFVELDRERRRVERELARLVGEVDRRGAHRADGHVSAAGWCRAVGRWSEGECRAARQVAGLLAAAPTMDAALAAGEVGVAQVRELARAFANPRCGAELVEVVSVLVDHARHLPFGDFRAVVRRWELLADVDGAERSAAAAHDSRHASLAVVGDEVVLRASGGAMSGAILTEVLERFAAAEFDADWAAVVAEHGGDANQSLLARTAGQCRFDALVAIFERAAAADPGARAAEPLVNVVVDVRTLHDVLLRDDDPPADPSRPVDPAQRRCETTDGALLVPSDVVAAAIWGQVRRVVVDDRGVVIAMGRRQRLFTGAARDAVMLQATHCVAPGCRTPIRRCQADHLVPWSHGGATDPANGAPLCGRHNRLKNSGYRVLRDRHGRWRTTRPDGTHLT